MTGHLRRCSEGKARQFAASADNVQSAPVFHLFLEGRSRDSLLAARGRAGNGIFQKLDRFLRDIWLEYCDHGSAFKIKDRYYNCSPLGDMEEDEMGTPLGQVLKVGTRFFYDYDFGPPTQLALRIIALRKQGGEKDAVELLSRNEPPEINCWRCRQPAIKICSQGRYSQKGRFCRRCLQAHRCGDKTCLPVVIFPRVGECVYTG